MADYVKPLPVKDASTAPFWEGCQGGEFRLQFCPNCRQYQFYPRPLCARCHSFEIEWRVVSGKGEIYTFTVVRQNGLPGFRDETPYLLAQVQLVEGPRLMTNIVDCPVDEARIGMPVEVIFERATDEISLPKFRPQR